MADRPTARPREVEEDASAVKRRRQAAYVFIVAYVLFCLVVIALMAVRSHQLGYGWF